VSQWFLLPHTSAHRTYTPPFIFRRDNSMFRHETPRGSAPPFRRLNSLAIPKVSKPCGEAPTLFSKLLLIKRCQVAVYSTGTISRTISQPSLVPSTVERVLIVAKSQATKKPCTPLTQPAEHRVDGRSHDLIVASELRSPTI